MVKWISLQSSELSFQVRVLVGAQARVDEAQFENGRGIRIDRRGRVCKDTVTSGHGLVVERVLAKDEVGVRFSLPAQV